jgi:hypothetical protein
LCDALLFHRVVRRRIWFSPLLRELVVKMGKGKDGAKKSTKFPGLVKKLEEAAAKKAPKGEQPGNNRSPFGLGFGKKR